MQFVMDLRDDGRHDKERHAQGDAGEPQQANRTNNAVGRKGVPAQNRRH
jgi:hypothetical protein